MLELLKKLLNAIILVLRFPRFWRTLLQVIMLYLTISNIILTMNASEVMKEGGSRYIDSVLFLMENDISRRLFVYSYIYVASVFLQYLAMAFTMKRIEGVSLIKIVASKNWLKRGRDKIEKKDNSQRSKKEESSISQIIQKKQNSRFTLIIVILFVINLLFLISVQDFTFSYVILGLWMVYVIYHKITLYRIKNGLFANNEHEARELIRFILSQTDKTDFFDDNGKQRRINPSSFAEIHLNIDIESLIQPKKSELV